MRPALDAVRYGLRALDEMAREQASVPAPRPTGAERFAPHPVVRPAAREGAALSLRLFTDAGDDATDFVLGSAAARNFAPIPARAAALFEAYVSVMAAEGDDAMTVGFPLVTYLEHGSMRVAPLFSRGNARARWRIGNEVWALPANARRGGAFTLPDSLVLELGDAEPYTLHAGVWQFLFGLDGAALGAIAALGRASTGALVRAAMRALESGEGAEQEAPHAGSLSREELAAFAEVAVRHASPSRALRCHPHGLAMLPPRGDPTSGLRSELAHAVDEPSPPRGPLAVYLGARAAPSRAGRTIFTSGKIPPTASQLEAAYAFEGTEDIVAVCGPPGCGKTALLHHVTAQTVVMCALGTLWSSPPSRAVPWPLVVASTNNAAVDQALGPFVSSPGLAVGIRLGNRHTLAETTAARLASVLEMLESPAEMSLADARAAFEARAAPVRVFLRERKDSARVRASERERREALEKRAARLRDKLAQVPDMPAPSMEVVELEDAEYALREHAEAAARLAPIHLDGRKGSVSRACEKWARANSRRASRILPVLAKLGIETPFGDLDPACPREDIERQRAVIDLVLTSLARARLLLSVPSLRAELATIEATVAASGVAAPVPPALDPGLFEAALAVRDAWSRTHRDVLRRRLVAARDAARAEWSAGRGVPLPVALRGLACLFPIAGCTLLSMRACFPLERDVIDRLVIDEAAQCAPIYAVPALARTRRAMLTGDTAQLPPVYSLDPHVDDRLARGLDESVIAPFRMNTEATSSAQAIAESRARTRLALTEHFRSQSEIVALASRWSGYTLDVRTPQRSLVDASPRLRAPVQIVPVRGVGARASVGVVNEAEAARAIELVTDLIADGVAPSDIAVLTPFVGQSVRIERELVARGLPVRDGVLVSTVHRLQGGERRVVVFSLTATEQRHLRWLSERPHLLHVATSRAQDHLVVLLDPEAARGESALAPFREMLGD